MGLYDRDYMREPLKRRTSPTSLIVVLALAVVFGGSLATGALGRGIHWMRSQHRQPAQFRFGVSLGPGVKLQTAPLHHDDPWASFLAPESVCPGRNDSSDSLAVQGQTALCLLNYARTREGLPPLPEATQVSSWSALKAADIARCDDFAHEPCGEAADVHARAAGYRGSWGENIYMGPQIYKTPLAAVDGWLNSPHHRENLFRPQWRAQGIAVLQLDAFGGQNDVAIWVSEFTDE